MMDKNLLKAKNFMYELTELSKKYDLWIGGNKEEEAYAICLMDYESPEYSYEVDTRDTLSIESIQTKWKDEE